jgi:hypothetical protein
MIVTIIEGLTKQVHRFAIRKADLSVDKFTSLFIEHYICTYGIPTAIVSDHDVRFQSNFWGVCTEAIGMYLRSSNSFHAQMDGLAKEANDTIHIFLRASVMSNMTASDMLLAFGKFTYNKSIHKVTQVTHFDTDLRYVPRLLIDFLLTPE